MSLGDEKFIRLTTFKRDGTPLATPVWSVPLDDRTFGFWTRSGSGTAKRLAHPDRVTVQPCDGRGKVEDGTSPTEATARSVSGDEMAEIHRKVTEKHGFLTKVTKLLGRIGGLVKRNPIPDGDRGVIVTPNP